jgi:hypothetical protein
MRKGIVALTALAVAWAPCATDWAFVGQAMAQQAATPQAAPAVAPADVVFTRAELETLLKPVALYPDPLLAQMLPASAYPLDIVQAARWLDRNKAAVAKNDFSAADTMPWDPSVKALLRFPDLIRKLNENLDWTSDLGDAFVNQPEDVATVIQDLRARAEKGGALKTTPQQTVVKKVEGTREIVYIEPADPEIIFVPTYDPLVVYDPVGPAVVGSLLAFGTGIAVGSIVSNNYWNWRGGVVYPPVWPGYPAFRPPYPGWRPGVTRPPNINIGNDINIGGGNLVGNSKPWRPDGDRYRPGQGSKPGLARPENRPGGAGPGTRPGRGDGQIARPGGLGGALGGAAGGALGGAIAARPGAGGDRPNVRPGGGDGLGRPGAEERPSVRPGGSQRPTARPAPANRPQARPAPANRPQVRPAPASRPQVRPAQVRPASVKRPQARPAVRPSGFDIKSGAGAAAFGNRGAASRAQIGRPTGGGGVRMPARGGGGARIGGGGGGGGARMGGGGGGARAGGGGGRRR